MIVQLGRRVVKRADWLFGAHAAQSSPPGPDWGIWLAVEKALRGTWDALDSTRPRTSARIRFVMANECDEGGESLATTGEAGRRQGLESWAGRKGFWLRFTSALDSFSGSFRPWRNAGIFWGPKRE